MKLKTLLTTLALAVGFTTAAAAASIGDVLTYSNADLSGSRTVSEGSYGDFKLTVPVSDDLPVTSTYKIKSVKLALSDSESSAYNYLVFGSGATYASSGKSIDTTASFCGKKSVTYTFTSATTYTVGSSYIGYLRDGAGGAAKSQKKGFALFKRQDGDPQVVQQTTGSSDCTVIYEVQIEVVSVPPRSSATVSADINWSEIQWDPAVTDPANTVLDLTVTDDAVITIDTTPNYLALNVAGTMKINTDALVGTDLAKNAVCGAPYSHWVCPKPVNGTVKATTVPTVPAGYTLEEQDVADFGARFVITAPVAAKFGAVSMNLHNGTELTSDETLSGAYPVAHNLWGNLKAEANKNATVGGVTFTIGNNASGYGINTYSDEIYRQYMDDSSTTRTISLSGITYDQYRIIVYFSTDTANYNFRPMVVNDGTADVSYAGPLAGNTALAYTVKWKDAAWGHTGPDKNMNAVTEGVNYLVTDVMTTATPVLKFTRVGDPRATPCGIQVVKVGEIIETIKEFKATVSEAGTKTVADLDWDKTFEPSAVDTAIVTIDPAVTDEVTLDFTAAYALSKFKVVSAGDATLKITGTAPTLDGWDFSGVKGRVSFTYEPAMSKITKGTYPCIGLAYDYTGTIQAGFEYIGANNTLTMAMVDGGTVIIGGAGTLKGDMDVYGNGSLTIGGTYTSPDNDVKLACSKGTLTIAEGADISVTSVCLVNSSDGSNNAQVYVNGKLTVTSACGSTVYGQHTRHKGLLFAHYYGTSKVTVGATGSLIAEQSWIQMTYTCTSAFDIRGLVKVLGINIGSKSNTPVEINGGTLALAQGLVSQNYGVYTVNGGTIKSWGGSDFAWTPNTTAFTGDSMIDPCGSTISFTGAITGSGTIAINDSSEGGEGLVSFTSSTVSGYEGTVMCARGNLALDIGTERTVPEVTFGGTGLTLLLTQTSEEFLAGETKVENIPAAFTKAKIIRADRDTVTVDIEDGTLDYTFTDNKLSGPATIMDFTFKKETLAQRKTEDSQYIKNSGSWGENAKLKYDGSYTASTSYNDNNGALLAKATPYCRMEDEQAWPGSYTVAVYANVPDVEKGCLIAFGSSTAGTKNYLAITRGETSDEILLMKGNGSSEATVKATMAAENATESKHLVVFTKDGDNFCVYCDGTKVTDFTEDFTLGDGFQIGSIHGGVTGTGIVRIDAIEDQAKKDAVEFGMIRVFNKVITDDEMAELAEEFSYVSKGGLYERTISADAENLKANGAWADHETGETTDLPLIVEEGGKSYRPSVDITVSVASTLTVNETAHFDKMTIEEGTALLTIEADEGKSLDVTGAIKVKSPIAFKYGVLDISKAPITISGGGSIELDLSTYGELADVRTTTRYQLTGLCDEAGFTVKEGTLPSSTYLTSSVVYADKHWWLEVTPNRSAGTVYMIAGTTELTDDTIVKTAGDEDALLLPGDTLVIRTSETLALNQTIAIAGITVDDGALVRVKNGADAYALNGETVTVNNGTLRLVNDAEDAKVNSATVNISEDGNLNVTGWITVDGTFAINSGFEKTVLSNTGANPIRIKGTGKIVKGGEGAVTFDCYLDNGSEIHPIEVSNGTLVMTQSAQVGAITGTGAILIPADKTLTAASCANATVLNGAGMFVCDGFVPSCTVADDWTGTVWIKNYTEAGAIFNSLGNANSTLRFTGVKGWFNYNTSEVTPRLELVDGEGDVRAIEVTDGSYHKNYSFAKIVGSGSFNVSSVHTDSFIVQIKDVSEYTGKLTSLASTTPNEDATAPFPIYVGEGTPEYGSISKITVADGTTVNAGCGWVAYEVAFGATLTVKGAVGDTLVSGITNAPALNTSVTLLDPTSGETVAGAYKLEYVGGAVKVANAEVTFTVPVVTGASSSVTDYEIVGGKVTVPYGANVDVVYTAEAGKLFKDGTGVKTIQLENVTDATDATATIQTALDDDPLTDAEAKIGTQYYLTLAEAFGAAEDGDTVTLADDATANVEITDAKAITLDLNGKTLTTTDGEWAAVKVDNADAVLTIAANGGKIVGGATFCVWARQGTVNIAAGTYENDSNDNYAIYAGGGKGTAESPWLVGTVNISGGTFVNKNTDPYIYNPLLSRLNLNVKNGSGSTITVTGGSYTADPAGGDDSTVPASFLASHYWSKFNAETSLYDVKAMLKYYATVYADGVPYTWAGLGTGDAYYAEGVTVDAVTAGVTNIGGQVYYVSKLLRLNDTVCEFEYDGTTLTKKEGATLDVTVNADNSLSYKVTTGEPYTLDSLGHACIGGVYYTKYEKQGGTVAPGGAPVPVTADTKEAAEAQVTVSATAPAGSGITDEAYTAYFKAEAVSTGANTWNVTAVLDEAKVEVADTVAEVGTKLTEFASGTETSITITDAKPGLYYSVEYTGDVKTAADQWGEGDRTMATSAGVTIDMPKAEGGATFYKVLVNTTDKGQVQ